MQIIVNGRIRHTGSMELSYEDVVALAFDHPPTATVLTVTYRHQATKTSGTLTPGQRVAVEERMIFNVADTSNA